MFIHRDRQQSGSVVIRPLSITQLPCMAVSQICQSIRALCQSASQSAADRPLCHDQSVRPLCHDQTVRPLCQTTVSDSDHCTCVRPLCQTTVLVSQNTVDIYWSNSERMHCNVNLNLKI